MGSSQLLCFSVRRQKAVLVAPATATPHEFKPLSDIDDQQGLRFQIPCIFFYRSTSPVTEGRDPARVIREGLAKALVHYYPLAGRLREWPGQKLVVECTAEGVLFVEADADVRLEQLGDPPRPPFPFMDELLHEDEASRGIVGCPLVFIQVTRLKCGGFVFALRSNHTVCDAPGVVQFMTAVGEMSRGLPSPAVQPVWARDLLSSRQPILVTHPHIEYTPVPLVEAAASADPLVRCSFFFGPSEMSALRESLPPNLRSSSTTFDIITACVWRCRNLALTLPAEQEVRTSFVVSVRGKLEPPLVPAGYYGNAFVTPAAACSAGELCSNPLGFAVELVKAAKSQVDAEYVQSVASLMVLRGRPRFEVAHTYLVSDVTRAQTEGVDFGWGPAVYGGSAAGDVGADSAEASYYARWKNEKGESGVLVPITLPAPAMEKFRLQLLHATNQPN